MLQEDSPLWATRMTVAVKKQVVFLVLLQVLCSRESECKYRVKHSSLRIGWDEKTGEAKIWLSEKIRAHGTAPAIADSILVRGAVQVTDICR